MSVVVIDVGMDNRVVFTAPMLRIYRPRSWLEYTVIGCLVGVATFGIVTEVKRWRVGETSLAESVCASGVIGAVVLLAVWKIR